MSHPLRRRTIESFDYQWQHLPAGVALASDPRFAGDVARILSEEELCLDRSWFPGKRVLDVGCGNGRWIEGFLELGAQVTATDAAPSACRAVRARYGERIEVVEMDILAADALEGRTFDLVFAWGVLHHTGDTRRALERCCDLVAPDGLLYLYLYGRDSLPLATRLRLRAGRLLLSPLSPAGKRRVLERRYRGEVLHNAFDVWAPPINDRVREDEVHGWLASAGFTMRRTIEHGEIFAEAWREGSAVAGAFRTPPERPYWFERLQEPS